MRRWIFLLCLVLSGAACARPALSGGAEFRSDRIVVTTQGSGPDVLLIPGVTASAADVWDPTVEAVPGYRYHLVQVRGFAGVPAGANGDGGPVVGPLVEEVARYVGEAHLRRPAVVGHSMGGSMALALAVRHPGLLSKVMVVDMVPFMGAFWGPPGTITPDSAGRIAERVRASWAGSDDARWRRIMTAQLGAMLRDERQRDGAIENAVSSDHDVVSRAMRDLIAQDLRADLARVDVPLRVLYVQGPHVPLDVEQTESLYREAYSRAPRAELRRIPDSSHFVMGDQPERFHRELREFLDSPPATPAGRGR